MRRFAALQEFVLYGNEIERGILRGGGIFYPKIQRIFLSCQPYVAVEQYVEVLAQAVAFVPVDFSRPFDVGPDAYVAQESVSGAERVVSGCKDSVLRGIRDEFSGIILFAVVEFHEFGVCVAVACL